MNAKNIILKLESRHEYHAAQLQIIAVKLADARTIAKDKLMANAAALGIVLTDGQPHDCSQGGTRRIFGNGNFYFAMMNILSESSNPANSIGRTAIWSHLRDAGFTYAVSTGYQHTSGLNWERYKNSTCRDRNGVTWKMAQASDGGWYRKRVI
jgi:hypothetical protein